MSFETIQTYVLPHWPFIAMAFILGTIGAVMKSKVWTKNRAAKNAFWRWARATMGFHALITGAAIAGIGWWIFGSVPVSPGVIGIPSAMLYYAGAGAVSSYLYAGVKYFAKTRGIQILELEPDSEIPAPNTESTGVADE